MTELPPTNDFGFTFEPDDAIARAQQALRDKENQQSHEAKDSTIANLLTLNREMYRKIMGLLLNLKKNPDSAKIHWPDRVAAVDKFIKELDELKIKRGMDGEEHSKG